MKEADASKRKAPDVLDENDDESDSNLSEEDKEEDTKANKKVKMPKKSKYRMRAHINPLNRVNFPFPLTPNHVNWKLHYPLFYGGSNKENENIYCNSKQYHQPPSTLSPTHLPKSLSRLMG